MPLLALLAPLQQKEENVYQAHTGEPRDDQVIQLKMKIRRTHQKLLHTLCNSFILRPMHWHPPPPGTGRGLVNPLYRKELARTPRQGVTAKCSWGEGEAANAEQPKTDNLASECIGLIGTVTGIGLNCPSLPWTDTVPASAVISLCASSCVFKVLASYALGLAGLRAPPGEPSPG